MTLRSETRATEASVSSYQVQHQASATAILSLDGDVPLTIGPAPVSRAAGQQNLLPALTNSEVPLNFDGNAGRLAASRPAGRNNKAGASASSQPESQFPQLAKCLKGCKDPVLAGPKIRKLTVRDFSMLEGKITKATAACKDALNLIQDDFDDEAGYFGTKLD